MSAAKQLAINRLRLPMDIVNIVKDFVFDDLVTGFIKGKKREINQKINQAIYSRRFESALATETSETWVFMADFMEKQIHSCNCDVCGNYLVAMNERLLCRCPHQNHNIEEDGPIDWHEEEEDDEPMWNYM
jgi:hypothetical protein